MLFFTGLRVRFSPVTLLPSSDHKAITLMSVGSNRSSGVLFTCGGSLLKHAFKEIFFSSMAACEANSFLRIFVWPSGDIAGLLGDRCISCRRPGSGVYCHNDITSDHP